MSAPMHSPILIARTWLEHSTVVDALGWTLVHSLWQGAAVAVLLAIVLRAMGRRSASARYIAAMGAMMIVPVGAAITFGLLNRPAPPPIVPVAEVGLVS